MFCPHLYLGAIGWFDHVTKRDFFILRGLVGWWQKLLQISSFVQQGHSRCDGPAVNRIQRGQFQEELDTGKHRKHCWNERGKKEKKWEGTTFSSGLVPAENPPDVVSRDDSPRTLVSLWAIDRNWHSGNIWKEKLRRRKNQKNEDFLMKFQIVYKGREIRRDSVWRETRISRTANLTVPVSIFWYTQLAMGTPLFPLRDFALYKVRDAEWATDSERAPPVCVQLKLSSRGTLPKPAARSTSLTLYAWRFFTNASESVMFSQILCCLEYDWI